MDGRRKSAWTAPAVAFLAAWSLAIPAAIPARQVRARSSPKEPKASIFSREPFSADLTIHGKSGIYKGKMYAGAEALRTDVRLSNGVTATVIVRYDKNIEWILMPSRHYVETRINEDEGLLAALRDRGGRVRSRDLGPEIVGAYPCEKYHVVVSGRGRKLAGWVWVARAKAMDGMIVKAQDQISGMRVELSDIQPSDPAGSLFDLPAGYHEILSAPKAPRSVH